MARWPRKNDPESIRARQEALGLNGPVTAIDLAPFASAQEMLTGAAVIPVSVVGPVELELGEYELEEPFGRLAETARTREEVYVPLAHTEGGLSASLYRGARAAAESGGFRTWVLRDRITRASCFVCATTEEAVELAPREAARGGNARGRADVPRAVGVHDGRRGRREHDDAQRIRAEHGLRD